MRVLAKKHDPHEEHDKPQDGKFYKCCSEESIHVQWATIKEEQRQIKPGSQFLPSQVFIAI